MGYKPARVDPRILEYMGIFTYVSRCDMAGSGFGVSKNGKMTKAAEESQEFENKLFGCDNGTPAVDEMEIFLREETPELIT